MIKFNPFDCELDEINESKLDLLIEKNVAESWYIEYKEFLINDPKKLAKSISAFANAEGGWYFMGVKSDKSNNIATEIIGIDVSDIKDLVDKISKQIVGNISPIPGFEIKLIELEKGNVVVIILVEEGVEPPYITSAGVIYQREHNASNPVRDRYLVEKMYEKTKNNHEIIERFSSFDYGETTGQGDSDQAYLELFLFPSPFNSFHFSNFFEAAFFENVADTFFNGMNFILDLGEEKPEVGLNLNFNAAYSSFDSLVIRPLEDGSIIYKGTTVELFRNGGMKLLLPLFTFKLKETPAGYEDTEVIKYLLDRFCPVVENYENDYPQFGNINLPPLKTLSRKDSEFSDWFELIDGHELILKVLYVVNIYRKLLNSNNYPKNNSLGFRALINNGWRKIIFFDNSKYLDAIKKYNIPATPKANIEIPTFGNGNYLKVENDDYSFVRILENIFEGIGIPRNEKLDYIDILKKSIENIKNKRT